MTKGVTDACPVASFDITTPNAARIYNYWLGGKDHFLVDRKAAKLVQREFPHAPRLAKANRRFLGNSVRFCAEQGITQLVDVGMGIPVSPTIIDVARKEQPAARMVGVDNDPVVLAHNRALVETSEGVRIIEGDVRQPHSTGSDPSMVACLESVYANATSPAVFRTEEQIRDLFDGLELVKPGLVDVQDWPKRNGMRTAVRVVGGVGRKA